MGPPLEKSSRNVKNRERKRERISSQIVTGSQFQKTHLLSRCIRITVAAVMVFVRLSFLLLLSLSTSSLLFAQPLRLPEVVVSGEAESDRTV